MKQKLVIKKVEKEQIKGMTDQYYKDLCATMDDMWEKGIIGRSNYHRISFEGKEIGYFCLDDNKALLQYFVTDEYLYMTESVFAHILKDYKIKEGFVSTIEPRYLTLSMDHQTSVEGNSIMFADAYKVSRENPIQGARFEVALPEEIDAVMKYSIEDAGLEGDWMIEYYKNIVSAGALHLLKIDGKIIGTGELRESTTQRPFADLGMTVGKEHRRKGLGSYILTYLKELCYEKDLKPICSTSVENISSKKAIENAGMYAYHRVLKVTF